MQFNGWEIIVNCKDNYEITTNETTLVVIDRDNDVALAVKYVDGDLKINHINYSTDFYINADNKELKLVIHDFSE
ncbi:hypothetical protein LN051_04515 [Staphylococcus ratti]|uniref:Phage protein n=2 Tax=Staphylococcus ratti TaxID=2892440 RepID=A0ABY3PFQ6_9STAP|nr:hypothetical protein [Staphylococcus ratti]UEX91139.1 hypothetical protein LN051_04515 [Staphylococcus ratti]